MASASEQSNSQFGRITDKTVYILGAGFSRLSGSPVLNSFIPQAFSYLRKQSEGGKEDSKKLLERFTEIIEKYGTMCLQFEFNVNNIEDIFSLVDIPVSNSVTSPDYDEKKVLIEVIIRTIHDSMRCIQGKKCEEKTDVCYVPHQCVIDDFMKESGESATQEGEEENPCPAKKNYGACVYEGFISTILKDQKHRKRELNCMDAVITFNWDLLLEEIIQKCFREYVRIYYGMDIGASPSTRIVKSEEEATKVIQATSNSNENSSPPIAGSEEEKNKKTIKADPDSKENPIIQLLKIHGSFNWRCKKTDFGKVTHVDNSKEPWEAGGKTIPLIPPTWKRGSSGKDIFTELTAKAVSHLQTAGKIIIIGYSMPDSDIYFRYLLAKALQSFDFPKIEVWDVQKKEHMIPKLEKLFGKRNVESEQVHYFDTGLLGYVTSRADNPEGER